jgi:hypothetical protein
LASSLALSSWRCGSRLMLVAAAEPIYAPEILVQTPRGERAADRDQCRGKRSGSADGLVDGLSGRG